MAADGTSANRRPDLRAIRGGKTPTTGDAWATEDSRYSPDRFYTASTDGKRDHGTVQIAIPMALLTQIDRLVQSQRIPDYQTRQDVIRDAIVHRLEYLARVMGVFDATAIRRINAYVQLATLKAVRMEKQLREDILRELEEGLKEAERTHDTTQIAEIFEAQEPIVDTFPADQRERGMRILAGYRQYVEGDGDG